MFLKLTALLHDLKRWTAIAVQLSSYWEGSGTQNPLHIWKTDLLFLTILDTIIHRVWSRLFLCSILYQIYTVQVPNSSSYNITSYTLYIKILIFLLVLCNYFQRKNLLKRYLFYNREKVTLLLFMIKKRTFRTRW